MDIPGDWMGTSSFDVVVDSDYVVHQPLLGHLTGFLFCPWNNLGIPGERQIFHENGLHQQTDTTRAGLSSRCEPEFQTVPVVKVDFELSMNHVSWKNNATSWGQLLTWHHRSFFMSLGIPQVWTNSYQQHSNWLLVESNHPEPQFLLTKWVKSCSVTKICRVISIFLVRFSHEHLSASRS